MNCRLRMIAEEVIILAEKLDWKFKERHEASTGTIYLDFCREQVNQKKEWIVIRVATHKQVYKSWVSLYSIAEGDLYFEELESILKREFGKVGDIL